jgi:glucose-6-phosphate isomerase
MNYTNFDNTEAWTRLKSLVPAGKNFDFRGSLNAERVKSCTVSMAGGLFYNWAAKAVNDPVLAALQSLADEQELIAKYRLLLDGEIMNTGEKRRVLHHLLRGQCGNKVIHEGRDLGDFYRKELGRFSAFAEDVRAGKIKSGGGKVFKNAVQIGIGG